MMSLHILIPILDELQWSATCSVRFTIGKIPTGKHENFVGSCMADRIGLHDTDSRDIYRPSRELNPDSLGVQPVVA